MNEFVQAPEQDVAISSRVRLARNYEDLPFSAKQTREHSAAVIARAQDALAAAGQLENYAFYKMSELDADARSGLVEHHLISYDLLKYATRAAALISSGKTVSIMLNEEDHLRIQGLLPGMQLERAAQLALDTDDILGASYPFAFDAQWGFLTTCPTNTGTGMRASVMLHLPGLARSGQMAAVMQAVAKLGLTVRGIYGEGSEGKGNLYQLSNQVTLGRSEEDVVRTLSTAARQMVENERSAREQLEKRDLLALQDRLLRSWGELTNAKLMSGREFMRRYSDIRFAASMGYLPIAQGELDQLMMDMQPGALAQSAGKLLSEREAEILRADRLRAELPGLLHDEDVPEA